MLYKLWMMSMVMLTTFSSCIDQLDLPIRVEDKKLVVEGFITDQPPPYTVRLSYTGNFLSSCYPPDSLAAIAKSVVITDDTGNKVDLLPQTPGVYTITDPSYVGQIGRAYTLTIELYGGKILQSKPEKLLPAEFV